MAQHVQLYVVDLDAPAAKQQLQQRNERQVSERQDHRTILSAPATPDPPGRSEFWHPSGDGRATEQRDQPARASAVRCAARCGSLGLDALRAPAALALLPAAHGWE